MSSPPIIAPSDAREIERLASRISGHAHRLERLCTHERRALERYQIAPLEAVLEEKKSCVAQLVTGVTDMRQCLQAAFATDTYQNWPLSRLACLLSESEDTTTARVGEQLRVLLHTCSSLTHIMGVLRLATAKLQEHLYLSYRFWSDCHEAAGRSYRPGGERSCPVVISQLTVKA